MRHLPAVLATGALLVLVAGCAHQNQADPGTAPVAAVASSAASHPGLVMNGPAQGGAHLPPGTEPVAGAQVDASALPGGFPRSVWTQDNGDVLGFYGEEGGCFTASASPVQQSPTQVTIRLIQQEPGVGKACPMYLRYKPMSVKLDQPLGKRTVVLQLSIVRS